MIKYPQSQISDFKRIAFGKMYLLDIEDSLFLIGKKKKTMIYLPFDKNNWYYFYTFLSFDNFEKIIRKCKHSAAQYFILTKAKGKVDDRPSKSIILNRGFKGDKRKPSWNATIGSAITGINNRDYNGDGGVVDVQLSLERKSGVGVIGSEIR